MSEAGSSTRTTFYPTGKGLPRDQPPPNRLGPSRYENDLDRDERLNGFGRQSEPSGSRPYPNYSRGPPPRSNGRTFNGRALARTPSPPRRPIDRAASPSHSDVRDRLSLDTSYRSGGPNGPFSGPPRDRREPPWERDRDRDRDIRGRWGDRDRDRDRRDERISEGRSSGPSSGRPSPPKSSSFRNHSPPSGPRHRSDRSGPSTQSQTTTNTSNYSSAPNRIPSGPRSSYPPRDERDRPPNYERSSFPTRDRDREPFARDADRPPPPVGGSQSVNQANQQTPRTPSGDNIPKAPRSMRGSSSPVESKHPRPLDSSSASVPISTIPLPKTIQEVEERELEEGEVISPVRVRTRSADRSGVSGDYNHNRRRSSRGSWSPDKAGGQGRWGPRGISPRKRGRSPSPRAPWTIGQAVDDGWGSRRRSAPSSRERNRSETDIQIQGQEELMPSSLPRPSTPPLLADPQVPDGGLQLKVEYPNDLRPITPPLPLLLDTTASGISELPTQEEPSSTVTIPGTGTPVSEEPMPAVQDQASPPKIISSVDDLNAKLEAEELRNKTAIAREDDNAIDTVMEAAEETANAVGLSLDSEKPSSSTDVPSMPKPMDVVEKISSQPNTMDIDNAPPPLPAQIPEKKEQPLVPATDRTPKLATLPPPSGAATPTNQPHGLPVSPRPPGPTLAERRSVQLPPTNGPLSSPFADKTTRKDPVPTAESAHESTDTEVWAQAPEQEDDDDNEESELDEADRSARLVTAIKNRQANGGKCDIDAVLAWNHATAPIESDRVPSLDISPTKRDQYLREITWPLNMTQSKLAGILAHRISVHKKSNTTKNENLKNEYRGLDDEWQDHCRYLDNLMAHRGQPPQDLYSFPNTTILPAITPGPGPNAIPTTPISEELVSGRNRRRAPGAVDHFSTEAEFQEILAQMADSAAKDPNYRASKTTAAVPDMLPLGDRKLLFDDDNDHVEDPISFYDCQGSAEPIWSEEERAIFLRRYLNNPKQFGKIADGLPEKTASDCVLYYYRTKKEINYKGMLASKRGTLKKKALPIKKGGKSAALLADLAKHKQTVDKSSQNAKSGGAGTGGTTTPAKLKDREDGEGSARRSRDTTGGTAGRRRKVLDNTVNNGDEANPDSEHTSRANSEAPSTVGKIKARIGLKVKRPRISSLNSTGNSNSQVDTAATPGVSSDTSLDPTKAAQAELLPPVKRARKSKRSLPLNSTDDTSQTQVILDPGSVTPSAGTPGPSTGVGTVAAGPAPGGGADKPSRRSNTSSYWSVEEKKRVKELFFSLGRDIRLIAAEMTGKTERQVGNFIEAHRGELGIGDDEIIQVNGSNDPRMGEYRPRLPSTYELYTGSPHTAVPRGYPSEPRLGVFPSTAGPGPSSSKYPGLDEVASAQESPVKHISRPGGMRISALLNDDTSEPPASVTSRKDVGAIDALSDGTIDEQEGITRPSPRSIPPNPTASSSSAGGPIYDRYAAERRISGAAYGERPDLDRYAGSGGGGPPKGYYDWPRRDSVGGAPGYYPSHHSHPSTGPVGHPRPGQPPGPNNTRPGYPPMSSAGYYTSRTEYRDPRHLTGPPPPHHDRYAHPSSHPGHPSSQTQALPRPYDWDRRGYAPPQAASTGGPSGVPPVPPNSSNPSPVTRHPHDNRGQIPPTQSSNLSQGSQQQQQQQQQQQSRQQDYQHW